MNQVQQSVLQSAAVSCGASFRRASVCHTVVVVDREATGVGTAVCGAASPVTECISLSYMREYFGDKIDLKLWVRNRL